ncbi:MAG TPA: hypothetical protein GXZ26_10020 [Firmicutes bacterium]|nr:hypothetical protein [Bacillota bacterium]
MNELEKKFFEQMKEIYYRADKEIGYKATRFLQMLSEMGGVATAVSLVSKPGATDGFIKLWENQRLDLSVEALVLKEEYKELFSEEIRTACANRLKEYGFNYNG